MEITPKNLDVISVVDLQHDASRRIADEFVFQICHRNIIQPRLDMIAFNAKAQRVPFAFLQDFFLLVRNLLESDRSEFVIVYGRRRVGKTFLIDQYFKMNYDFSFVGSHRSTQRVQLRNF